MLGIDGVLLGGVVVGAPRTFSRHRVAVRVTGPVGVELPFAPQPAGSGLAVLGQHPWDPFSGHMAPGKMKILNNRLNQSRQPTPGVRLGCIPAPLARPGCAYRQLYERRYKSRNERVV